MNSLDRILAWQEQRIAKSNEAVRSEIVKGDTPGHEFHGNQWFQKGVEAAAEARSLARMVDAIEKKAGDLSPVIQRHLALAQKHLAIAVGLKNTNLEAAVAHNRASSKHRRAADALATSRDYNASREAISHSVGAAMSVTKGGAGSGRYPKGSHELSNLTDTVLGSLFFATPHPDEQAEYLDETHTVDDVAPESREEVESLVSDFMEKNADEIAQSGFSHEDIAHQIGFALSGQGMDFPNNKDFNRSMGRSFNQMVANVHTELGDDGKVYISIRRNDSQPSQDEQFMRDHFIFGTVGFKKGGEGSGRFPKGSGDTLTPSGHRAIAEIAQDIWSDWGKQQGGIYFGAKPYLEAMGSLSDIKDNYGLDSARSIVSYFLANASRWKGETAKAIKAELKKIVSTK